MTVIAWLLCRLTIAMAWAPARDPFTFDPTMWSHWDSRNYLAIAAHGRNFGPCGTPSFPAQLPIDHPVIWCGLAGWLPGYPWLIRGMHAAGIALPDGALAISWLAMAAALFLVWFGWGRDLSPGRSFALLLLVGLFPGSVYDFAVFPTSLALACVVGAVLAASREKYLIAVLLMTAAGLCYPSAWFAAAGLAAGLVLTASPLGLGVIVRRSLWAIAAMGSLLVLGVHDQLAFGHADAYLLVQTYPGASAVAFPGQASLRGFSRDVLAFQAVASVVLAITAFGVTAVAWLRTKSESALVYPALIGITVIIGLVASVHDAAWSRSIVLAAPCVVCLRRLPLPVLYAIVVIVGMTGALISRSFFDNQLV